MKYNRTELLLVGLNVLSLANTLRVPNETYRTLKQLDICAMLPTIRGKRAGVVKRNISSTNQSTNKDQPTFCLLNARSLTNKWDEITDFVLENDIDALSITETWLSRDCQPPFLPDGYSFIHVPRPNRRGGGVGLLY